MNAVVEVETRRAQRAVVLTAAIAGLGGLLFGYDTGVIASALLFIEPDFGLSSFEAGLVVAAVPIGAVAGCARAAPQPDTSPEHVDVVGRQTAVRADQLMLVEISLGDQEAVEGVSVMPRQRLHPGCVPGGHRKLIEVESPQRVGPRGIDDELPQRSLDRDLPDAGGADREAVRRLLECRLGSIADRVAVPEQEPDDHVRVEQQRVHAGGSNPSGTSSNSGPIEPSRSPQIRRAPSAGSTLTSLATGSRPRRITTVSPASTRRSSFESLASWQSARSPPSRPDASRLGQPGRPPTAPDLPERYSFL